MNVNTEGQGGRSVKRKRAAKTPVPPRDGVELLTVPEAAYLVRSSVDLVYRLIAAGKMPSVSVGAKRFVTRGAVSAYLASQTTIRRPDAPTPPAPASIGLKESGLWDGHNYL